jgi:DNA-binding transcriptional ArsR family regulator
MRLGIVSALAAAEGMSLIFTELRSALNATDGNLGVHARKLEDAGYVSCEKTFAGRTPRTEYKLTAAGRWKSISTTWTRSSGQPARPDRPERLVSSRRRAGRPWTPWKTADHAVSTAPTPIAVLSKRKIASVLRIGQSVKG